MLNKIYYGNKANNIIKIKKKLKNVKIPKFYLISFYYYNYYKRTKNIHKNIIKLISKKIYNDYIIRSSTNLEDSKTLSFAGIFESKSSKNLIKDIKTIYNNFNKNTKLNTYLNKFRINKKVKLSLIIQEKVSCDISGVIFSNSPINIFNEFYHIEIIKNNLNDFKNNNDHKIIIINKNLEIYNNKYFENEINRKHEKLIKLLIKEIPKKFYPFDIEFGIRNDEIYLFQIRPITTLK